MGEVILRLPDDGTQENLLPVAGRVFVVVRSGIQTSCSRSTPNPCCAARRRDGAVTDIESRLLGIRLHSDVQDAPTIRSCQKHPDQQELPVLRPRLRSVPWPVRPGIESQVWTGDTAAPLPEYELRTGTPPGRQLKCRPSRSTDVSTAPRTFTHRILGENPQLAARVAVQFQNSEARLLQSPLIPAAHGTTIWSPRSVGTFHAIGSWPLRDRSRPDVLD